MTKSSNEWHLKGRELQKAGKIEQAVAAYQEALKLQTNRLDSRNNLAILMQKRGLDDEAEELLIYGLTLAAKEWKICKTQDERQIVGTNWAHLLNSSNIQALQRKQFQKCIPLAYQQIQLAPDSCGYVNLGVAFAELGYPDKAKRSHLLGLKRHQIKWEAPEELIGKKLDYPSESSQLQRELTNLATCQLQTEPLSVRNWHLLLSRLGITDTIWLKDELPWEKLWTGNFCNELLIWDEQGFGDALQCLRWIKECGQRTKELTLMLRPQLLDLINKRLNLPLNCNVVEMPRSGPPLKGYSNHCPLMGLPVALANGGKDIPTPETNEGHWLKCRCSKKRQQIGIVWSAGTKYSKDAQRASDRRSISASQFLNHALRWKAHWGAELISLQLGREEPIADELIAAGEIQKLKDGGDWESTAKVVEKLSLIVTVDTAMAHLAGNMGVPCLLLLNRVHDWRWGTEKNPVRWYSKQHVLRCKRNDDWEKLLQEADSWVKVLLEE